MPKSGVRNFWTLLIAHDVPAIAVPGWNLEQRRDAELLGYAQRSQTIARPTVKHVVTPGREMARRNPIDVFLFRTVIIRALEGGEQAHRMPAQGLNKPPRNLFLSIIVTDRFAEKTAAISGERFFKRFNVETGAADPRGGRVEQILRQ